MPTTGRWDLALHWVLYSTMFLNAPMFRHLWIRELHRMQIPVSVDFVDVLLKISGVVFGTYLAFYAWHVWRTAAAGKHINPIKYAFIGSSYFLWYFAAWHTNSILLYAVAHRIMHGVQYMVIVYFFLRRKSEQDASQPGFWSRVVGQGRLRWFLVNQALNRWRINHPFDVETINYYIDRGPRTQLELTAMQDAFLRIRWIDRIGLEPIGPEEPEQRWRAIIAIRNAAVVDIRDTISAVNLIRPN